MQNAEGETFASESNLKTFLLNARRRTAEELGQASARTNDLVSPGTSVRHGRCREPRPTEARIPGLALAKNRS
jgi:hypothetical protein